MEEVYGCDEEDFNEWDISKERYLKKIADYNGAFVWMHNKTASSYTILNKVWSIIVAVGIMLFGVGGITGLAGFESPATVLTFQILTIIAGVVSIVQSIVGLDGMADNHNDAAIRNSEVFLSILKELGEKNVLLRIRGDRFIHMMIEKDTIVKSQSPRIPSRIVKKYYNKFGKHAVRYDMLFGNNELLKIDKSLLVNRQHEHSLVKMLDKVDDVANDTEESLKSKIKEHDKNELDKTGVKIKRKAPALSALEMSNLEKYLNE